MKILTEDAVLLCDHRLGRVAITPSQKLVKVAGRRALVSPDPAGKAIGGCPNMGPTIKPCTNTLAVTAGYSAFVRIDGLPVCLDTVRGLTDGTPPGTVNYSVQIPGQTFVNATG